MHHMFYVLIQCPVLRHYIGHRNIPMRCLQLLDLIWRYPRITKTCKSIYRLCVFQSFAAKIGVTRLIPGISESDAIINGTLTDTEKEIYKAVFYSRIATVTMINECESVKANAKKVQDMAFRKFQCYCLFRTAPAEQGLTKKRGVEYRKSILLKLIMQSILNWTALIMFTTMNIKKLVKILFNFY